MPAPSSAPALPASQRMRGLVNMPTALNSAQLARLDATTRRLSFFSATVEDAHLLQGLRQMVQAAIDEGLPESSSVERMRQWIRETRSAATGRPYLGDRSGWTAEEKRAYENSVKHIDSLARLKLIFRTQAEMGAGYNQWQKGYTRLSLAAYPGWKFYRRPGAKTFRADHVEHDGQVRLKTDLPYWLARNRVEIGGFANPWPPFGYNSWMWIAPVSRAECEKLGLLKQGEGIVPLTDEQADTWGVPRLLQTTLGDRSGRVLDAPARQHVIDTCKKHGFDVRYNEQTGKFEFIDSLPSVKPQTREEAIEVTRTMAPNVAFHPNVTRKQITDFNEALGDLLSEFSPKKLKRLGSYVGPDSQGAHANSTRLEINADHETGGIHGFKRWTAYAQPDEDGFTRYNVGAGENGISMRDVVTHEFGHVLSMGSMRDELSTGQYRYGSTDAYCHTPTYKAIQKVRRKATKNRDILLLSRYAETDPHEFFSESFTAWRRGESLPEYIVDMLKTIASAYVRP